MGLEKAVEQVYRGRERMIIIGLTGRIGMYKSGRDFTKRKFL